jgi:hypothetical protein
LKLLESIRKLGGESALAAAAELSIQLHINWDTEVKYLFRVIATDLNRVPGNIGGQNDDMN